MGHKQSNEVNHLVALSITLCIAQQNRSIGVNVVYEGSPSLILRVLLISLGITIRPKSSTLLTIPVAFIYLSPFTIHLTGGKLPPLRILTNLFVGAGSPRPRDGKPVPYNINFINYAVSICQGTQIIPKDLLWLTYMI